MTGTERRSAFVLGLLIRGVSAGAFAIFFAAVEIAGQICRCVTVHNVGLLVMLLIVFIAVNPLYWWWGKRAGFPLGHFVVHWMIDTVGVAGVVYVLGGSNVSIAAAAFMIMIVSSATLGSRQASTLVAAAATVLYGGLIGAQVRGLVTIGGLEFEPGTVAREAFIVGAAATFFFLFAFVAGRLADRLRRQAEQLAEQKEIAERSYRNEREAREEMRILSALVEHDVRNPLIVVDEGVKDAAKAAGAGQSELAVRELEAVRERVGSIERAIASLQLFRDLDRGEAKGRCDVRAVIEEVVNDLRQEAREGQVEMRYYGTFGIASVPDEQLYHVVRNLVANAVRAVAEGYGRVEVQGEVSETGWTIRVMDNGCGLGEEYQRVLREGKEWALGKRGPSGGFGAGLALCRSLVERWNGRLEYSEREGGGSVLTIRCSTEMEGRELEATKLAQGLRGR